MKITKYRIINKYRMVIIAVSLMGMFIYWGISSKFFAIIAGSTKSDAAGVNMLLSQILTLDNYMDVLGFTSTIMVALIFSTVILFYREKNGLISFRYMRGESQKKVLISTILSHAAINAVLFYVIYVIYLVVGYALVGPETTYIPRNSFDAIFGEGFSSRNSFMYYLFQGIPSHFIATFVYTVMACSVGLFCRKAYQGIIVMLSYYWGMTILIEFARRMFMNPFWAFTFVKFEPTFIYGYQGISYKNPTVLTPLQLMESLVIPVLASTILIIIALRKKEKLYE